MNNMITLTVELGDKIGSYFTFEMLKKLFGSFQLMHRFFKEHADDVAPNVTIKPSI